MAFDLHGPATELGVRDLIGQLITRLRGLNLREDLLGTVEIALSEVLNNIVEHSCAGLDCTRIRLICEKNDAGIQFIVVDQGNPLPDEKLPAGAQVDVSGPVNTLPEGGFGWFLIRTLSDRLEYRRVASENHLSIWFSLSSDAAIRHSVDK